MSNSAESESASAGSRTTKNRFSPGNRQLRIEKSLAVNLVLLLAPVYSLLVNGYQFGIQDHDVQIPEVIRLAEPGTFPNDYFFDEPSDEYTLWIPAMAFLARRYSLEVVCLVGYLVCYWFLFWTVYHIALNLFRSRSVALLALFLLLVQRQVGGTKIDTLEINFGIRTPAIACALTATLLMITDRTRWAAFFTGISFLLHPLIALPTIAAMLVRLAAIVVLRDLKTALQAFAVLALTMLPLLCLLFMVPHADRSGLDLLARAEPRHLGIVQIRCPYFFLSNWPWISCLSNVSYAALLAFFLLGRLRRRRLHRRELRICELFAVCICLDAFGFVFTELYPSRLIIQMQVFRCFYLIVFLATICSSHILLRWAKAIHLRSESCGTEEPWTKATAGPPSPRARWKGAAGVLLRILAMGMLIGMHMTFGANIAANLLLLAVLAGLQRKATAWPRWTGIFLAVECVAFAGLSYLSLRGGVRLVSSLDGQTLWGHDAWLMIGALVGSLLYAAFLLLAPFRSTMNGKRRCAYGTILVANAGLIAIILFARPEVCLPGQDPHDPLADVARWCEKNTPKDGVFLIDPMARHFRILSKRSIVGDAKDGAKAAFSQSYAYEWFSRMEQLADYDRMTDARCAELARQYGATHAITLANHRLGFPMLYDNGWLHVYRVAVGAAEPAGGHGKTIPEPDAAAWLAREDAAVYLQQGSAHFEQGQYGRAVADWTEAIRLDPTLAAAYNNRGFAYRNLQEFDKAIADYTKAIELSPQEVTAYGNRGSIYGQLGEYEKAVADFTRLIELDRNSAHAYDFRGVAYGGLGQHDKSLADFNEAIRLDSTQAQFYLHRAAAYRALGDEAKADADERMAQELNR